MYQLEYMARPAWLLSGFQTCGTVYAAHGTAFNTRGVFMGLRKVFVFLILNRSPVPSGCTQSNNFPSTDPTAFFLPFENHV